MDDGDTAAALVGRRSAWLVQHMKAWRSDVELDDVRRIRRQPGLRERQNGELVVGDDVVDHGGFVDDGAGVEQADGDVGRSGSRSGWSRV